MNGFRFLMSMIEQRRRLKITPPPKRREITLEQWRDKPELVAEARTVMNLPSVRLMLEVLANESPVNYHDTATNPERVLGRIEGYNLAMNNLAAMAASPNERISLEATFEPERESKP